MIYKYSQLYKRISFNEARKIKRINKKIHIGQLKLLYSEILFLTKHAKNNNKVLYIGAGPGYHIAILADMFPNLNFHLWDPVVFEIEKRDNIKIFNNFFTNSEANQYKKEGNNILFISDIRNLNIAKFRKSKDIKKMDKLILDDMDKQIKWIQIINPIYAYLKFRLPFEKGITKSFNGTIYLQPFSPISTETRLMTNNYNDFIGYNNIEFDEKLAYFNCCIRSKNIKYIRWSNVMNTFRIKNNWDNALALYIIDYYLRKVKQIKSDQEVGKMFVDIIDFHKKKYKEKFNILFL